MIGTEAHRLAWKMAKARTEEMYNLAFEALKETHRFCAEWLNSRKDMFASYILIERRNIVTTNPVEQFNNTMLEARESPISDALLMLMKKSAQATASVLVSVLFDVVCCCVGNENVLAE